MDQSNLGITDVSNDFCTTLLYSKQTVPSDSLFSDDRFVRTCRKIQGKNEARVVQDISRLIVPSAETLATYGATNLDHLNESVNKGWNSAITFYGPRLQPDYSVGFGRSAFTDKQLEELTPFVGEIADSCTSYFMGRWRMYFPFLTCEVKCGAVALDIADRQDAHNMTLAVRGVVELYKAVKREKELHREILAFSVSHDHKMLRIYDHYPVIEGDKTTFYRYPVKDGCSTIEDGKDKWAGYKFIKNVYDVWMPIHLKRICSAIDELPPDLDFRVALDDPLTSVASADESELPHSQDMATSAPASQNTAGFKKPRLPPKVMLQQEVDQLKEQNKQLPKGQEARMEQLVRQNEELMSMLKQRIT